MAEKEKKQEGAKSDDSKALVPRHNNLPAPTIEEMVKHISKINTKIDKGKMEIGEYVLENVFGGDLSEISSKASNKRKSLRRIVKSIEDVSEQEIGACVRAAYCERILNEQDPKLCKLVFSAKKEIGRLVEKDKIVALAKEA